MAIYGEIVQKLGQMKRAKSGELANFLEPSQRGLGDLLVRIYGSCGSFNPDPEIAMSDKK